MRERAWQFLQFAARACVIGERTTPYYDRVTREKIDTRVEAPLWAIGATCRPAQPSLFRSTEVPTHAEVMLSRGWIPMVAGSLAQFLPMGELLGNISGDQPSGAWARVVGLALANYWRRHPREVARGNLGSKAPTRRELLTRYTPKKSLPDDILSSRDPSRAVKYWSSALSELVSIGFLALQGEAARGVALQKLGPAGTPLSGYGWSNAWLDTPVELLPGEKIAPAIEQVAHKLPSAPTPRALTAAPQKRGRQRKQLLSS